MKNPTKQSLLSRFGSDPLYYDVITAPNLNQMQKALDTLRSIRGFNAIKLMQDYSNQLTKGE